MKEGIEIRPAEHSDVSGIVLMHADSIVATYKGVTDELTQEALRAYVSMDEFVSLRTEALHNSIKSPKEALLVADADGTIVGFAGARVDSFGRHRMKGLYVADSHQGLGVGRRLFTPAIDWHPKDRDVYLRVVPGTPAEKFHEKFGFQETNNKIPPAILQGTLQLPQKEMKLSRERR